MSTTAVQPLPSDIEKVLIGGDLAQLQPTQRLSYYNHLCNSLGLNPLTKPFQYLNLGGKTVLYATKDCTEQLRKLHVVSVRIVARESVEGCYVVTAQASLPSGRCDESIGAVPIDKAVGEARSNAIMKAETKAKRRVTLSICGLGMLDESETDSIPGARMAFTETPLQVAERQIAENNHKRVEQGKPAIVEANPASETVAEMVSNGTLRPLSELEERHKATIMEANTILDEASEKPTPRKKGSISFKALGDIKTLKDELRKLTGTDAEYYACLGAYGVDHADGLEQAEARAFWKALAARRTKLAQDVELKKILEDAWKRLQDKQFLAILGSNGCTCIEEVMQLNGTALSGLLSDLKLAVDGAK